jgi:hypothetical protein
MRYAIDPPTLVHLAERDLRVDPGHQLVAPNSIRSQALQLLLERVRGGEVAERDALRWHERMTELKIRLLGDRVSRRTAWGIAVEQRMREIRDAEYLAVARLQADALIALGPELAAAAAGIVPLATLADLLE